ncbi:unnamed protein product, partial [Ectocarpus sp. 13 AM-2016]
GSFGRREDSGRSFGGDSEGGARGSSGWGERRSDRDRAPAREQRDRGRDRERERDRDRDRPRPGGGLDGSDRRNSLTDRPRDYRRGAGAPASPPRGPGPFGRRESGTSGGG